MFEQFESRRLLTVNDAPSGTDNTLNMLEDPFFCFRVSDFGFTDPNDSPANNLQYVKITTLPSNGYIAYLGTPINVGDEFSAAVIGTTGFGSLEFHPDANASGSPYTTFTFQVRDDGGTANGGVDLDPTPNTITVNVTSVNDAPSGTNNSVNMLEDPFFCFRVSDFGFTDPNDSSPNSLQYVKITSLPSNGYIAYLGTPINVGDEFSAAVIGTTGFGSLEFHPAANASGSPYTTFTFQVRDDGGTANGGVDLDPTPNTITVNVTPVNDAPSGTNDSVNMLEDPFFCFRVSDFGFSDPNDSSPNSLQYVKITTLPSNGYIAYLGTPINVGDEFSAGVIGTLGTGSLEFHPAANASGSPYTTFTFQVRDNGGTANGGVDLDPTPNTITVNVTPVNDAPSGTDNTLTTAEDTMFIFRVSDFGFSDPNDSSPNSLQYVKITTLPSNGYIAYQGTPINVGDEFSAGVIGTTGFGSLEFHPDADENGSPYTSFTFQVRDNGGTANGGVDLDPTPNTITFDVTPVDGFRSGGGGEELWSEQAEIFVLMDPTAQESPKRILGADRTRSENPSQRRITTFLSGGRASATIRQSDPNQDGGVILGNVDLYFERTAEESHSASDDLLELLATDGANALKRGQQSL